VATNAIDIAHQVGAGPQVIALVNSGKLQNLQGLRNYLNVVASEVKQGKTGRLDQLLEAADRAKKGSRVSLEREADVVDIDQKEALQLKTVTSPDARRVVDAIQEAINQIAGARGETPPAGFKRIVQVTVRSPDNPIGNANREGVHAALKGNLSNLDKLSPPGAPEGEVRITSQQGAFTFKPGELK
jgi:hypothetical protein